MKRFISALLAICIVSSMCTTAFATNNITAAKPELAETFVEKTIERLRSSGIDVIKSQDGEIQLVDTSAESIARANSKLENNLELRSFRAASSYPTAWVHEPLYDVETSKKFQKATKSAFAAAFFAWVGAETLNPKAIAKAAAAAYATYYFVESDEEDIYLQIKYYYRETGPGRFDYNGNFMGDYQIKKVARTTLNSDYTGGQVTTTIKDSTIIEPFF